MGHQNVLLITVSVLAILQTLIEGREDVLSKLSWRFQGNRTGFSDLLNDQETSRISSWQDVPNTDVNKSKGKGRRNTENAALVKDGESNFMEIAGIGHYKVVNTPTKWETARRHCKKEGGHLLIINSAEEAMAVSAVTGIEDWNWIGFDDYTAQGEFITLHGTTLEETGYTRWASGEPTKDLRCGVVDQHGLLGTSACNNQWGYICEKQSSLESGEAARREAWLPAGFRGVGDLGFYRVHRDAAAWETARRRCEAEGAHLMVPNSLEEAAAVLRTSGLDGWLWLGFDDYDAADGVFVNFDGQTLGESGVYSNFASGEPTSDHCGLANDDGYLGTGYCNTERGYICELYNPGEKSRFKGAPASSPPSGYVAIGNSSYYKVHTAKAEWETARRSCQAEGAHLMVVNTKAEAEAVLKTSDLPEWFLLGFDDYTATGEFVSLDGSRLEDTYMEWASGEPTDGLHCGCARTDGLLGSCTCKIAREYICEWEKPGARSAPTLYPHGFRAMGGFGFYKVHREEVVWETARRRCEAEGAHLLVINSKDEADAVAATSALPSWFWVGFDDFDREGEFLTLLDSTLSEAGYDAWSPGEPTQGADCGVARVDGLLGTATCKSNRPFICELNIE